MQEFKCIECNFSCKKRGDFNRHLKSKKHNNLNNDDVKKYTCLKCNKVYMSRTGLWRHKKTCNSNSEKDYKKMYLKLLKEHNKLKKEIETRYNEIIEKQLNNESKINELMKNIDNSTISQV